MQRRKYLIGVGSLAAGSAAAIGTGAFESASINDRDALATVVNDNQALLRLDPTVSQHARLKSGVSEEGELIIDLQDLNQNANFTFEQLVRIHNDGNQAVDIRISLGNGLDNAVDEVPGSGGPGVSDSSDLRNTPVRVESGEYVDVGAEVTTTSGLGTFNAGTFTVHADPA